MSKVSVVRRFMCKKGLDFEKKALSSLSTSSVVLVPLVKAETQGRCCSAFKKHTGDLTHTQMHTKQNSLEQPELKAQASVQHVIMERPRLVKNSSEGIRSESLRSPVCCSAD